MTKQVRDGQLVVPTCPVCGCRLAEFESMWYHYLDKKDNHRDGRWHLCPQLYEGFDFAPIYRLDMP